MNLFAGVDIGSTTAKCVITDENDNMLVFEHIPTEYDRNVSGEKILKQAMDKLGVSEADIAYIVSTGYGRKSFLRANANIPEIIAHGLGTYKLMPGTRTIIDIGGQDSKVISLDDLGNVERFEMNDKCAAGTGRFFEVLTHRLLGIEMDELSDLILKSQHPIEISSMCTIFAESEIISHLSQETPVEDIAAGTGYSIARRILSQSKSARIEMIEPIVFSGGAANNDGIRAIFEKLIGKPVIAAPRPQCTAAMGAAIRALKDAKKKVAQ